MYINVSVPLFDSDVYFLLLSSLCIYAHVKLSRKSNTPVSSRRQLDRNTSLLQLDMGKGVNKFENGKFWPRSVLVQCKLRSFGHNGILFAKT